MKSGEIWQFSPSFILEALTRKFA